METEDDDKIQSALDLIEKFFSGDAEKISTVAFVNWHNIVNHAALEELNAKQVLFVCNLILALASVNFEANSNDTLTISNALKQVSFDETLDFLAGEIPPEDKDV